MLNVTKILLNTSYASKMDKYDAVKPYFYKSMI